MAGIRVESACHLGSFQIKLVFSDGVIRVVDFGDFLRSFNHPDYDIYLDEECFGKFVLRDGNIDWNDYHMIFSVESLYLGKLRG